MITRIGGTAVWDLYIPKKHFKKAIERGKWILGEKDHHNLIKIGDMVRIDTENCKSRYVMVFGVRPFRLTTVAGVTRIVEIDGITKHAAGRDEQFWQELGFKGSKEAGKKYPANPETDYADLHLLYFVT